MFLILELALFFSVAVFFASEAKSIVKVCETIGCHVLAFRSDYGSVRSVRWAAGCARLVPPEIVWNSNT